MQIFIIITIVLLQSVEDKRYEKWRVKWKKTVKNAEERSLLVIIQQIKLIYRVSKIILTLYPFCDKLAKSLLI